MSIDPEKVLPSWRFLLSNQMEVDAKKWFDFIDFWPPHGWTEDQIKRHVEKTVIGKMETSWPMIYKIDQKLDGLVSKTLMLMCHRPRDLPNGYRYLFGHAFKGCDGPDAIRASFRRVIDHKRSGGAKQTFVDPGEEEYDDARIIAISSRTGDAVHRDDLIEEAQVKLDKKEAALKKQASVNSAPFSA